MILENDSGLKDRVYAVLALSTLFSGIEEGRLNRKEIEEVISYAYDALGINLRVEYDEGNLPLDSECNVIPKHVWME